MQETIVLVEAALALVGRGLRVIPLDHDLLDLLDAMSACAGVALGVERLPICLADTDAIADVLAFAFSESCSDGP